VADNVVISHRGATYEIGRGRGYYGIWPAGAPHVQPAEWWPPTPAGWSGAWSRFTRLEAPTAIVPVRAAPILNISASTRSIIAVVLLAVGVVFGAGALFPGYFGSPSLASEPSELVPHLIYLVTWAASAGLILLGGARLRLGALLATGVSVVTFGLYFADLGTAVSGSNLLGAGLVLGLIGWLSCAAGAAVAVFIRPVAAPGPDGAARLPAGAARYELSPVGRLVAIVIAGLGAAVAFAPAWDSYTLRAASGQSESLTAGNAFANPAPVIAGNLMVMIALVAVLVVAALLRPVRHGAVLLIGAVIPMVAQAVSAVIQLAGGAAPSQFGISAAQAALANLTISSGVTAAFWVYCAFVAALLVIAARMLLPERPAAVAPAASPWAPAAGPVPAPAPMTSVVPGAVLSGAPAAGGPGFGAAAPRPAGTTSSLAGASDGYYEAGPQPAGAPSDEPGTAEPGPAGARPAEADSDRPDAEPMA
jgi:hypothetical protein